MARTQTPKRRRGHFLHSPLPEGPPALPAAIAANLARWDAKQAWMGLAKTERKTWRHRLRARQNFPCPCLIAYPGQMEKTDNSYQMKRPQHPPDKLLHKNQIFIPLSMQVPFHLMSQPHSEIRFLIHARPSFFPKRLYPAGSMQQKEISFSHVCIAFLGLPAFSIPHGSRTSLFKRPQKRRAGAAMPPLQSKYRL